MQLVSVQSLGMTRRLRAWSPLWLGSSLIAFWDAERSDLVTRSGGLVSSWKDVVGGYDVTQATGASKPVWTTGAFNSRPGLIFDGVDDQLSLAGFPAAFPTGANPCWMWGCVSQEKTTADSSRRDILQYGDSSTTVLTRRISRTLVSAENRFEVSAGNGVGTDPSTNASVVFLNRHVVVGKISGANNQADADGVAGPPVSHTPTTTASQLLRIGAAVNGGDFWGGRMSAVLVTLPLSADEQSQLYTYLNRRI